MMHEGNTLNTSCSSTRSQIPLYEILTAWFSSTKHETIPSMTSQQPCLWIEMYPKFIVCVVSKLDILNINSLFVFISNKFLVCLAPTQNEYKIDQQFIMYFNRICILKLCIENHLCSYFKMIGFLEPPKCAKEIMISLKSSTSKWSHKRQEWMPFK